MQADESQEELNGPITAGASFGWPCFVGAGPVAAFQTLQQSPCAAAGASALPPQTAPFFSTPHRAAGDPGTLSALSFIPSQNRFYIADYMAGTVSSLSAADKAPFVHKSFVYAVQLAYVPPAVCSALGVCGDAAGGAMLAVDVALGSVREVPTTGFAPAAASAAGGAALSAAAAAAALALAAVAAAL